ncbi:hypothetical protein SGPA1_10836 [Streptomyces misionensis JCM 4497]
MAPDPPSGSGRVPHGHRPRSRPSRGTLDLTVIRFARAPLRTPREHGTGSSPRVRTGIPQIVRPGRFLRVPAGVRPAAVAGPSRKEKA